MKTGIRDSEDAKNDSEARKHRESTLCLSLTTHNCQEHPKQHRRLKKDRYVAILPEMKIAYFEIAIVAIHVTICRFILVRINLRNLSFLMVLISRVSLSLKSTNFDYFFGGLDRWI